LHGSPHLSSPRCGVPSAASGDSLLPPRSRTDLAPISDVAARDTYGGAAPLDSISFIALHPAGRPLGRSKEVTLEITNASPLLAVVGADGGHHARLPRRRRPPGRGPAHGR